MHLVSKLARTQVTVALSGDGGDELFAGYNRHAWLERLWTRAAPLPDRVRRAAGSTLLAVPPGLVDGVGRASARAPGPDAYPQPDVQGDQGGKVLSSSGPEDAYLALVSCWDDAESSVLGAGANASLASRPSEWPALDGITEQMMWLDVVGYLPDDILTKLDRAAMATSLESRVPFLDRDVFDVAWRLPLSAKLHEGTTKWILRQVLYRHVPAELIERPKMGFGFPIGAMLRGPLRPWGEDLLDEGRLRRQGVLDPEPIRRAWDLHQRGRRDLAYELWTVLALQAWIERWMPGSVTSGIRPVGRIMQQTMASGRGGVYCGRARVHRHRLPVTARRPHGTRGEGEHGAGHRRYGRSAHGPVGAAAGSSPPR